MQASDFFEHVIEFAAPYVNDAAPHTLSNPTACSKWDVRTLLNHMVYELLWMPDLLAGKTVEEVGNAYEGDVLGNNARSSWDNDSNMAITAVQASKGQTVHLSYGDVVAEDYIQEVATDILIHTWDLGKGLHRTVLLPEDLAQIAYAYLAPKIEGYRAAGVVGPAVAYKDDDLVATKLLALSGRNVNVV